LCVGLFLGVDMGFVVADGAADRGAGQRVMAGYVACHTAYGSTCRTAGRMGRQRQSESCEDGGGAQGADRDSHG